MEMERRHFLEKQKDNKPRIHIGTSGHVDGSRDTLSAAIDRYLSSQNKTSNRVPPAADGKFIYKKGE